MKKLLALILCLCLAVSLAAPAFASEADTAAQVADVLAAIPAEEPIPTEETDTSEAETGEEAGALLTEEPIRDREDFVDEGGDEPIRDREDSTDEGGDEDGKEEDTTPPATSGSLTETIFWSVFEDGGLYILFISGDGPMPDYDAIGKTPWFPFMDKIAVIILDGITHVGDNSFAYLQAVTTVTLSKELESIGESAFRANTGLKSIDLPASLKTIGRFAFSQAGLTSVTLPEGLQTLGDSAFNPCNITEITLPGSITSLGAGAFAACQNLKTIHVGEGITHLNTCFINCYAAETLNLPSTIETLDHNFIAGLGDTAVLKTITVADKADGTAFRGWKDDDGKTLTNEQLVSGESFTGMLTAQWGEAEEEAPTSGDLTDAIRWAVSEDGTLSITGTGAMPDDKTPWNELSEKITAIEVGEGITSVGKNAFRSCDAAKTLSLPSTIQTLGANSLPGNLESITVTEIGGRKLLSWIQNRDDIFSTEDLLTLGSHDTLTARWYGFTDVDEDDWFYDYVMFCYDYDLMKGMDDGSRFAPNASATRAQVVTVLYRLMDEPAVSGASSFSDVPAGEWYADAVAWADANGIAVGYDDGTFKPNKTVSRQELLVFLNRLTKHLVTSQQSGVSLNQWSELYELDYSDANRIASWALEAETWSVVVGLQAGYANGDGTYSLKPAAAVSRAELATFLNRFSTEIDLYLYAEIGQILVGSDTGTVTRVLGEPEYKMDLTDGGEMWGYDKYSIGLIIDYSENTNGLVVGWMFTTK